MESNSDKQLRDKLTGVEFPFDPQAWQEMEAMLNKKKKRRGFFWWWFSGSIAAALFFGTVGYELHEVIENKQKAFIKTETTQTASGNLAGIDADPENTSKQNLNNNQQANEKQQKQTIAESSNKQQTKTEHAKNSKPERGQKLSAKTSPTGETEFSFASKQNSSTKNFQRQNRKESLLVKSKKEGSNTVVVAFEKNHFEKEAEALALARAGSPPAEKIEMGRMESLLEFTNEKEEYFIDKTSEDALPKKKKRVFNYSIGVLANVTGTTLGGQSDNKPERPPLFYNQPSYMIGFTHDFLFVKRVAITNSVLFSKTSFKIYNPKTVSFTTTPKSYTSNITELNIPIGIKVYLVVKNNFSFYLNVGIINHIKLKETFNYTVQQDTVFNSIVTFADSITFPLQTSFTGDYESNMITRQNASNGTDDFSINSAKRYYVSFYASAGIEYTARKRFIFFAEPLFYMSLQEIGVQDKRKYNFGVSGGFRYKF